jgi:hypothetical protein
MLHPAEEDGAQTQLGGAILQEEVVGRERRDEAGDATSEGLEPGRVLQRGRSADPVDTRRLGTAPEARGVASFGEGDDPHIERAQHRELALRGFADPQREIGLATGQVEHSHRGQHLEADLGELLAQMHGKRCQEIERQSLRRGHPHGASHGDVPSLSRPFKLAGPLGHSARRLDEALAERGERGALD